MMVSRMMAVFPVCLIADDQLALPAADRDHGVDRLDSCLQWLTNRLAVDNAGSNAFDLVAKFGDDRALPVERHSQRIDHAADQRLSHWRGHDRAGALDRIALFNEGVFAKQNRAHLVFFQVEGDAEDVVRELQHLAGHNFFEAVDARDSVADGDDRAHLINGYGLIVIGNLCAKNLGYFVRSNGCHACFAPDCLLGLETHSQPLELRAHRAVVDG